MHIGPRTLETGGFGFTVWAPRCETVQLQLLEPEPRLLPMQRLAHGYFHLRVEDARDGQRYRFLLNGETARPDPASHHQPGPTENQGEDNLPDVHGPSALVDHRAHVWQAPLFIPPPLEELVIYELHVGAFTPQGTFDAARERLDYLVALGVNAVELMPVAQFPGTRNWGYDGVQPFAVQHSHGGPAGLKRFVDACHSRGLAVLLDVVYNHLGPEGNYLRDFAPYFTDSYRTPWGEAVNFDGPHSDHVREYFIQNALHWLEHYRMDGLRLDATHAMFDERPVHFLEELAQRCRRFERASGRRVLLIAESDRNDPRLALPRGNGGMGLDAIWSDDFHHGVHALLTGERDGYYMDYGAMEHVARSLRHGFAYQGEYSAFRQRGHGARAAQVPAKAHVFCIQNHDQVGNRMHGERLAALLPFEALKAAAALLLFAPGTPLLFMGEEYGENAPFLYFISHHDQKLVRAVRKGRRQEFKSFAWQGTPPDPQDARTFQRSLLDWGKTDQQGHRELLAFYTRCIQLRRGFPPLRLGGKAQTLVWTWEHERLLVMRRGFEGRHALCLFNLHAEAVGACDVSPFLLPGNWEKELESSDTAWSGPGASLPQHPAGVLSLPPLSAALYLQTGGENDDNCRIPTQEPAP
jgi:maltooligosyltrehalose trehalohydrolase